MRKLLIFFAGIFLPYVLVSETNLPEKIKSERSDSLYQAAIRAFENENWSTAANWLGRYLNENPGMAHKYLNMHSRNKKQGIYFDMEKNCDGDNLDAFAKVIAE